MHYRNQKGEKKCWNIAGYLMLFCVEKNRSSKCKAKMLLKCPDINHHMIGHRKFNDNEEKYGINLYKVIEYPKLNTLNYTLLARPNL